MSLLAKGMSSRNMGELSPKFPKHGPGHKHRVVPDTDEATPGALTHKHSSHAELIATMEKRKSMVRLQAVANERAKKNLGFLKAIKPDSKMMRQWDGLMFLLIAFTAAVTPFEIAFLKTKIDVLFVVNRCVDSCFLIDMGINCFLSYYDEENHIMVQDIQEIAGRYLRGWFIIDLLSILPFDSIALSMDLDEDVSNLKIMRLIRLMRLIKLVRILRASRIFTRIQATLSWSFSSVALCRFLIMAFVGMHWFACLWKITADLQEIGESWLYNNAEFVMDMSAPPELRVIDATVEDLYVASFEFAIMSMSLGYGPTKPTNTHERVVAVFSLILAGSLYAYIIGAICGVLAMRDPASQEFRENMDTLNLYMQESRLPFDLKVKLRMYFTHCRHHFRNQYYQDVITKLSPALLGELAEHVYSDWIAKITFFNADSEVERNRFIRTLAINLETKAFAPREILFHEGDPATEMFIVELGFVGMGKSVFMRGQYFGEEMLLTSGRRRRTAIALVYVDLFNLQREALIDIIRQGNFPETAWKVRRKAIQLKMREMCSRLVAMVRSMPEYEPMTKEQMNETRLKLYRKKEDKKKKVRSSVKLKREQILLMERAQAVATQTQDEEVIREKRIARNRQLLGFYKEGHKEGYEMSEELQDHLEEEFNSLHFDGNFFDGKDSDVQLMKPMRSMDARIDKIEGRVGDIQMQVDEMVNMQRQTRQLTELILASVSSRGAGAGVGAGAGAAGLVMQRVTSPSSSGALGPIRGARPTDISTPQETRCSSTAGSKRRNSTSGSSLFDARITTAPPPTSPKVEAQGTGTPT